MASDISKSKTEYLKRYTEGEKKGKRKKKPKLPSSLIPRIKIVDQNIDVKAIKFGDEVEDDDDEAPLVAEIIDERPVEMKMKEVYEASRWKKLDSASEDDHTKSSLHSASKRNHNDSDNDSLPQNKHSRTRMDSDSDCSPPRRCSTSQNKNPIKARHDSGSDCSPPWNPKKPAKNKSQHDSDSDMSPPRRNNNKHGSIQEYKGKVHRTDQSRRNAKNNSDSDLSPERRRSRKESSPRRKTRGSDSDLSPPRKDAKRHQNSRDKANRPIKTLSGLKAGLQNSEGLINETHELRRREKMDMEKLGAELSGRNAETIVRDRKTGKRRNLEEEDHEKEEEKRKLSEKQKKYSEWGKGIEQTEGRKSKFSEDLYEMSKPLARHCDDDDLEQMLKSKILAEDPMAEYMAKKKQKEDASRMPEYSGPPPPPNRFGLRPGYRWDGVDRSNGFEKKYFEKINSTKAGQEEAYLWSVQDM